MRLYLRDTNKFQRKFYTKSIDPRKYGIDMKPEEALMILLGVIVLVVIVVISFRKKVKMKK